MISSASPGPYTWDDFVALEDDDRRELIDGELVEVEVPTFAHEAIVTLLIKLLAVWADTRGAGEVLASGAKVRISPRRGLMPDVQFYAKGGTKRRPDLSIEVISPSSRRYDRVTKLGYYAERGVPEYWIVDPDARTIERLVLRDGCYAIEQSASEGDVFRPSGFDGLEIALADVWAAAERANEIDARED